MLSAAVSKLILRLNVVDCRPSGPSPFLGGFGILEKTETPTCQVPKNVLLLVVVVWCLKCNDQKEGGTKDPSESPRGLWVRTKEIKTKLMTVRIGKNTFNYELVRTRLIITTTQLFVSSTPPIYCPTEIHRLEHTPSVLLHVKYMACMNPLHSFMQNKDLNKFDIKHRKRTGSTETRAAIGAPAYRRTIERRTAASTKA